MQTTYYRSTQGVELWHRVKRRTVNSYRVVSPSTSQDLPTPAHYPPYATPRVPSPASYLRCPAPCGDVGIGECRPQVNNALSSLSLGGNRDRRARMYDHQVMSCIFRQSATSPAPAITAPTIRDPVLPDDIHEAQRMFLQHFNVWPQRGPLPI